MSENSQIKPPMRERIIQALLPSNIKILHPSENWVSNSELAKSLEYKGTSDIEDALENLEKDRIIERIHDKKITHHNRCRLKQNRRTIKKIYCDEEQYEDLRPQIRADFSEIFFPGLTKGISEKFNEIIQEMSKKSDFIFTIIVKHTTEQKFSSAFASYLDTYHVLGIEEIRNCVHPGYGISFWLSRLWKTET